jgi:hypothetical protein
MTTLPLQGIDMNSAAITRHNLIDYVRTSQSSLSERAAERFERFVRQQGGAVYELASVKAVERAFSRFEWSELDRIFTAMFNRMSTSEGDDGKSAATFFSEARLIVRDKLRRALTKTWGWPARLIARIAFYTFLAVMFTVVSSMTSELLLHFFHK